MMEDLLQRITVWLSLMNKVNILTKKEQSKIKAMTVGQERDQRICAYQKEKMSIILIVVIVGFVLFVFALLFYEDGEKLDYTYERPAYGKADIQETLVFRYESQESYEEGLCYIEVPSKEPTQSQKELALEQAADMLPMLMLYEGDSQQDVKKGLRFDEAPFIQPIFVEYESMNQDVLLENGSIRTLNMEEGILYPVDIQCILTYGELERKKTYKFVLKREALGQSEIQTYLKEAVEIKESVILLPAKIKGTDIEIDWYQMSQGVSATKILIMVLLLGLGVFLLFPYRIDKEVKKYHRCMEEDVPVVISQLTILLNSGMDLFRAWQRIVSESERLGRRDRPLYRWMLETQKDIENGMSQVEAIEAFGQNIGNAWAQKLSVLIVGNFRKGQGELVLALKQLGQEVWQERRYHVKEAGEKVSTKLLLPLGLNLIIVMVMILTPAFLSIKI